MILFLLAVAAIVLAFLLTEPIAQDPGYHVFADERRLLSIANFWNVASNVPFLIIGAWGILFTSRYSDSIAAAELRMAYRVFFTGILLTAFGSAYYHLDPTNASLVVDRLPMTIAFAGLFAIIVGEFLTVRFASKLLPALLVVGIGSVGYWAMTEARGNGDLRPYAIVQFLPMLLVPVILLRSVRARDLRPYIWLMIGCYATAKIFEHFDAGIYAAGNLLSGHTLKHLFASLTAAILLAALLRRRAAGGYPI